VSGAGVYDVSKLGPTVFAMDPFHYARNEKISDPFFVEAAKQLQSQSQAQHQAQSQTPSQATTATTNNNNKNNNGVSSVRSSFSTTCNTDAIGSTSEGVDTPPFSSQSSMMMMMNMSKPEVVHAAPLGGASPTRLSFGYPGRKAPPLSLEHAMVEAVYKPAVVSW
jgi:hypothetical protein